jgi:hypothetical protein
MKNKKEEEEEEGGDGTRRGFGLFLQEVSDASTAGSSYPLPNYLDDAHPMDGTQAGRAVVASARSDAGANALLRKSGRRSS